jgi:prevent-host-death family protein
MATVTAFDAKTRFGELLDRVAGGEEIVITRRGRAVARLVPAQPGFDRDRARRAAAGILGLSRGLSLNGLKIKDLIGEGRA